METCWWDRRRSFQALVLATALYAARVGAAHTQDPPEAWRAAGAAVHAAAITALERIDAELVRLHGAWQAEVVGRARLDIHTRRVVVVDAAPIDAAIAQRRSFLAELRTRLDRTQATYVDSGNSTAAARPLGSAELESMLYRHAREINDQVIAWAVGECWSAHVDATGFGDLRRPGRAHLVAAEVQPALDAIRAALSAQAEPLSARYQAGELLYEEYLDAVLAQQAAARVDIDAIVQAPALRARLESIRDSLKPARRELAGILDGWARSVAAAAPVQLSWRDGFAKWFAEEVRGHAARTLDRESIRSQALSVLRFSVCSPIDPSDEGRTESVEIPFAFDTSVAALIGLPGTSGAAELPRPIQRVAAAPPPARICAVELVPGIEQASAAVATRTLCLFGLGLLDGEGHPKPLTEADEEVSYAMLGGRPGTFDVRDFEPFAQLWRAGIAGVTEGLPPSVATAFKALDAVLVEATIAPGVLPGPRSFRVGDADVTWVQDTATASARIEFVRLLPWTMPDIVDRPDELFLHDAACIQVETSVPLSVDQLPLIVLRNRQPVVFSGDAAAIAPTGEPGVVIAHRLEAYPTLFRTRSFTIDDAGRPTPPDRLADFEIATQASVGDVLWATTDGILFVEPVADRVAILGSPDRIETIDGKGMLFSEAIRDASLLHELTLSSLDVNRADVVDTVWHTYPTQLRIHEIQFSVADHAAMLLLKRTFLRMAQDHLARTKAIAASDALIRAHVPDMARQMREGASAATDAGDTRVFPLGFRSRIVLPREGLTEYGLYRWREGDGFSILIHAFDDEGEGYFVERSDFEQWRFACTREALRLQIEATERAIEFANDADDDEVDELLEFTGRGFEPLVARIMPRLVQLESDPSTQRFRWTPHQRARELLTDLTRKLFEHEIAGSGARASQEALLAVVTAAGLGIGGHVVGKAVLAIASAVSLGYAGMDVITLEGNKAEVEFATDAIDLIGRDRLRVDLSNRDISATPYVTLALSLFGLRCDVADLARGFRLSVARSAMQSALRDIEARGVAAWGELTDEQQLMALVLIQEVRQARAARKALTRAQEAAERAGVRLERSLFGRHPFGWPYDDFVPDQATVVPFYLADSTQRLDNTVAELTPRTEITGAAAVGPPAPRPVAGGTRTVLEAPPPGAKPPTSAGDAPAPLVADHPTVPPPGAARRQTMDPRDIPTGMPLPGYAFIEPETGRRFVVGDPLGKGVYATAYELLDESGAATGRVIKFLRHHFSEGSEAYVARAREAARGLRDASTQAPWDPTELPAVIDRMLAGQQLLERADIPHLPLVSLATPMGRAGRNAPVPFVVQDLVPDDPSFLRLQPGTPLDPAQQRAVALLYKRMAEKGLVWKDGHHGNIYLKSIDGDWQAGVLDSDMIAEFEAGFTNTFVAAKVREMFGYPELSGIASMPFREELLDVTVTPAVARTFVADAFEFMAKMLEHRGWVRFETYDAAQRAATGRRGEFQSRGLDLAVVTEVFGDLNQWVRPGLEVPTPR